MNGAFCVLRSKFLLFWPVIRAARLAWGFASGDTVAKPMPAAAKRCKAHRITDDWPDNLA
jgi:hypothetical protein